MLNFKKSSFLFFGFFVASVLAWGQAARSPFSYRGIGEPYGNSLTHNQGMAGVGLSNPQYFYLNNQNPALLVFNRFTVFEAGFIGEKRTTKGNGLSETNSSGNLNYLATGFPVKPGRWSTSIALMPYSTVNYKLDYVDEIIGTTANTVNVTETGEGGINQFSWSNGIVLNRSLSIGLKASYLFGSIIREYSNTLTTTNDIIYSPTVYARNYVKDFNFTAGFSYHKDSLGSKKNYTFNIGAVYTLRANLNDEYFARIERRTSGGVVDSTTYINNVPGSVTIPSTIGVGLSLAKGDFLVIGADFTYSDFRKYKDFSGETPTWGTASWKSSIGTEFTPVTTGVGSYLKRITYRTGVSYETYPYLINNNMVKDFGVNLGFSLPISRISSLDFAVKVGKRGNQVDNTIEEKYFKIYFGMTFNDQWFIKRRFD